MSQKLLSGIKMGRSWTSYISAAYGVLHGAGLWNDGIANLLGMTGMGFHFIVHRQLCPSSVTVYDWLGEHFTALDRIGIYSEGYEVSGAQGFHTLFRAHEAAVRRIKASIERGVGVIVWAPTPALEFGIITGYDDADRIFFVEECSGKKADPLLWANLGKSLIPILYYQIVKDHIAVDPARIYRESLESGIREWRKPFHIHPDYAGGAGGYRNLIAALEKNDFDDFGLAYILAVYGDAKKDIAEYLAHLTSVSPQLAELVPAVALYRQVAEVFQAAAGLIPFSGKNGSGCPVDRSQIPETLRLMKQAHELEERTFQKIEQVLNQGT